MNQKILLLTAPFTQLNTPYPATAYLKGFLNTLEYDSFQADLGIELILQLFSRQGLTVLFENIEAEELIVNDNMERIIQMKEDYLACIDSVIKFLQGHNNTLAHRIVTRNFLPEAGRFHHIGDMDMNFGKMGIIDQGKYLATLFIEDIGDLITTCLDPFFGFSRYAERLGMSASSFDELYGAIKEEDSLIDDILIQLVDEKMEDYEPGVVCISIPFPGNLYASLKCGLHIKENYPGVIVVFGGGYPNTELRSISDARIFESCDYISLDDGEAPLKILLNNLFNQENQPLKRMFTLENGVVIYKNTSKEFDVSQLEVGTPDYSDLLLDEYISVIEFPNPMHRLWSDGRWNKLTLAHGCYWGKCTFCDVTLDYIGRYEPITASVLCDRIEAIIEQTGDNGFHFVDEAAPPALLRDLSIEILRRKMTVVWWTNIRFEKSFTADLCQLLADAGCIAISAGLEVASDRLLKMIKKGVSVAQVAQVSQNLTNAGVMVHAYLMYGFPTQTEQETIDSFEMVRQLFKAGVVQSGYWHRFALTVHSPVGKSPELYDVKITEPTFEGFAQNDLSYEEPNVDLHEKFGPGLKKGLYNFMHSNMLNSPLNTWFEFDIPRTSIARNYITNCLTENNNNPSLNRKVVWTGNEAKMVVNKDDTRLIVNNKNNQIDLQDEMPVLLWYSELLKNSSLNQDSKLTYKEILVSAKEELSWSEKELNDSENWILLRENGLLFL